MAGAETRGTRGRAFRKGAHTLKHGMLKHGTLKHVYVFATITFASLLLQMKGKMLARVSYNKQRSTLKDVEAMLRCCYLTLLGVKNIQLGTDETPERWLLVICINYSRVEGANSASIKPERVIFFSKAGSKSGTTCANFKEESRDWPMNSCFSAIISLVHLVIIRKTGGAALSHSI